MYRGEGKFGISINLWVPRYTEGLLRRPNYFAGPSIIKSPSLRPGKANSFTRNLKVPLSEQCKVFMQLGASLRQTEALHVSLSVAALEQ